MRGIARISGEVGYEFRGCRFENCLGPPRVDQTRARGNGDHGRSPEAYPLLADSLEALRARDLVGVEVEVPGPRRATGPLYFITQRADGRRQRYFNDPTRGPLDRGDRGRGQAATPPPIDIVRAIRIAEAAIEADDSSPVTLGRGVLQAVVLREVARDGVSRRVWSVSFRGRGEVEIDAESGVITPR
ncbi:MAG: hypothetical protein R3F20_00275 [Planctomycetota bacterium]